jgi:cytoskeletal protein RodZ
MPVGKTLAAARRAQGKTLSEIQAATRIMGRKLEALEAERWDDLPAPVYVKGYIQNYATALGLDPEPLLAEYAADTSAPTLPKLERIPGPTIVPHRREVHTVPRQVWIILAALVLVVALGACGIAALFRRDDTPPPIPPATTTTPETTTTVPGVSSAEASIPATDTIDASDGVSFTLTIEVEDDTASWVRVFVDGGVEFEGTLDGGSVREYNVTDEAIVRIGKPASVTVKRDDQVIEVPLGEGIAEVRLDAGE